MKENARETLIVGLKVKEVVIKSLKGMSTQSDSLSENIHILRLRKQIKYAPGKCKYDTCLLV